MNADSVAQPEPCGLLARSAIPCVFFSEHHYVQLTPKRPCTITGPYVAIGHVLALMEDLRLASRLLLELSENMYDASLQSFRWVRVQYDPAAQPGGQLDIWQEVGNTVTAKARLRPQICDKLLQCWQPIMTADTVDRLWLIPLETLLLVVTGLVKLPTTRSDVALLDNLCSDLRAAHQWGALNPLPLTFEMGAVSEDRKISKSSSPPKTHSENQRYTAMYQQPRTKNKKRSASHKEMTLCVSKPLNRNRTGDYVQAAIYLAEDLETNDAVNQVSVQCVTERFPFWRARSTVVQALQKDLPIIKFPTLSDEFEDDFCARASSASAVASSSAAPAQSIHASHSALSALSASASGSSIRDDESGSDEKVSFVAGESVRHPEIAGDGPTVGLSARKRKRAPSRSRVSSSKVLLLALLLPCTTLT